MWCGFMKTEIRSYLIPAAVSAALLFATKETAMISAGVLIIALACNVRLCPCDIAELIAPAAAKLRSRAQVHRTTGSRDRRNGWHAKRRCGCDIGLVLIVLGCLSAFLFILLSKLQWHLRFAQDLCYMDEDRYGGACPSVVPVHGLVGRKD